MAKRKQHHEEHPDERWLITYADLLTLMFVLFMVLFSVASVNTSKFELLKDSLAKAFSITNFGGGGAAVLPEQSSTQASPMANGFQNISPQMNPASSPSNLTNSTPAQALESAQLSKAKDQIDAAAAKAGLSDRIRTQVDARGLNVRLLTDDVLFDSGSATLRPEAGALLDPVAAALRRLPNPVRVEGHTDSNPISTSTFPSNWELSGGRASAVVRYFVGRGVPAGRIEMVGYGDNKPIGSNATDTGRQHNRRVEVVVQRLPGNP